MEEFPNRRKNGSPADSAGDARQPEPGPTPLSTYEQQMEDVIRHQERWYVLAGSSRADGRTRVLKHGDTFGLFDRHGDVQAIGEGKQGLYHRGTRFLSHFELMVDGKRPLLLNSAVTQDNTLLAVDLTTPDLNRPGEVAIPQGSVHIARSKCLWQGVHYERLRVTNYADTPATVRLSILVASDFADLFEVRGAERAQRGETLPAEVDEGELVLSYRGLDGVLRRTAFAFDPAPERLDEHGAGYELTLDPGDCRELTVTVACRSGDENASAVLDFDTALASLREQRSNGDTASLFSSNEQFNNWVNRSEADLLMLRTDTPYGPYPYAGVPWFSTVFGRDGIITALQTLWVDPALARGVLGCLAESQATTRDVLREAEPGKIVHETREGEMATLSEIPFRLYYGTVDATPLFVLLAAEYFERTGDRELLDRIWPNVKRAIRWIDDYGDCDGDGFVEYQRRAARGLLQQGWKDSDDSIFHADGTPAEGPIALCEVQGYVYAAKRGAARVARVLGDGVYAEHLEKAAERLRRRFNEAFWLPDLGTYALALDGNKVPCRVRASNAGHALYCGIADEEKARQLADTLLDENGFNGWGVRTLAAGEPRYNPMSYHNGSVWPHDNAIIAAGLARYGLKSHALRILNGLFNASIHMDLARLPELFCGFPARPGEGPTLYPMACAPQAWAAGSVFQLVQAALGLEFSTEPPHVRLHHPMLPDYLERFEIRNLRAGNGRVDLILHRHHTDVGINVTRKQGDVEVAVVL